MKVLIVCSGNVSDFIFKIHQAFIYEQIESLKKNFKVDYDTYFIKGKGILGYLWNLHKIKNKIKDFSPDIIHAHFGLSGLVSCLQKTVPVIVTFHGSDAYIYYVKLFSKLAANLSAYNIFVEEKLRNRINRHNKNVIVPCGIDLNVFYPMNKEIAREMLGLDNKNKNALFASGFDNPVKNYQLAKTAVANLNKDIKIIELKNKTREEVNLLLNACDLLILTSISEGSPQIIKEAMACNCPIVATDVGDVKEIIRDTEGCFLVSFKNKDKSKKTQSELIEETCQKIKEALRFAEQVGRTKGRARIIELGLDSETVAKKIFDVYKEVLEIK